MSSDGLTSDFATLWGAYGWTENNGFSDISTFSSAPFHYSFSSVSEDVLLNVGYGGSFWSSAANGVNTSRGASFNIDGYVVALGSFERHHGFSVRCLLR